MKIPKRHKQLHDADWDFAQVPDFELWSCCYHEYLRETGFAGRYDKPWQNLNLTTKAKLSGLYAPIRSLKEVIPKSKGRLPKHCSTERPPPLVIRERRIETICWDYSDDEIADAFKAWLKSQNSKRRILKRADVLSANLQRLGIMRLMHFYLPSALEHSKDSKIQRLIDQRDIQKGRAEAGRFFKRLFSSAYKNGLPRTWESAFKKARRQKSIILRGSSQPSEDGAHLPNIRGKVQDVPHENPKHIQKAENFRMGKTPEAR